MGWSSANDERVAAEDQNSSLEEFARRVGQRLQQARVAKGLSQERVAHLAGIAGFTYQKFEKGESRPGTPLNPRLATLIALCQVLEIGLDELLAGPWPDLRFRA